MKAIILAAGKATRLLPLTKENPQSLLLVGRKTILEHQIDALRNAGIKEIIIVTGYLSKKIEEFCKHKDVIIQFNPFYEVSGMVHSLWVAREYISGDMILLYSDLLFDTEIVSGLSRQKGDICLAIKKNGIREEAEQVFESGGFIKKIGKSMADANGEFVGLSKFSIGGSKKLILEMNNISKMNLYSSFINILGRIIESDGKILSYEIGISHFVDIDFPVDLTKARKIFG
ncbi:MAG: phosphocholine cytidylyltransferase family protein [archaeon]